MTLRTITFDDEQFARAVYDNLAAADNQDIPLEEYPGRILSVLEQIAAPEPPAQQPAWLRVIDEALVCSGIGIADERDDYDTAKKKLLTLMQWEIDVACDPAVGGDRVRKQQPVTDAPVAWLHDVVSGDREPDQALSFSPDNFPLEGVGGFRSVRCRPLYLGKGESE